MQLVGIAAIVGIEGHADTEAGLQTGTLNGDGSGQGGGEVRYQNFGSG